MDETEEGGLSKWVLIVVAVVCVAVSVACFTKSAEMFKSVRYEVRITNVNCLADDETKVKDIIESEDPGIETIKHEITGSAKTNKLAVAGGMGSGLIALGIIAFLIWRLLGSGD